MTHFSENPGHVRVDRFKPSGKWYDTFTIDMSERYRGLLHNQIRLALQEKFGKDDLGDWIYVILDPYHEHSHPQMIKPHAT
jgi:hypothetical protein